MQKKYIMAMDQGTTSSRAILFDRQGRICSMAQKEFAQSYPKPGWVEHDPMEIWASQVAVSTEVLAQIGASVSEVAAIGITNQRETTVVWDKKTGQPVYPAIVWQCRRTAEMIDRLKKDGLEEYIRRTTGLVPDAYFSASKLAWILENTEGAKEKAGKGELLFGTIDTWLIWNLTGGVHVTDHTNASRTMLFDIHKGCWDRKILDYFGIPACMLPEVKPSSCVYGMTRTDLFGRRIPIAGAAGDQQAALFGQCCFEAGQVKNTYGTGCFMLMHTGSTPAKSENGLLTTMAASPDGSFAYALEGSVFVAGAGIQWLRDELQLISSAPESEEYARSISDTGGVYVVPAFTGLGAPYWDAYARGTIVGLTRGSGKAQIIRATLESMAYQTCGILKLMEEESGVTISALKVDGGASNNDFLMQFQADILNAEVHRPASVETTALGAAYLAGLACGFWKDTEELKANLGASRIFRPEMAEEKRQRLLKGWERAVERAGSWAEETGKL